MNNQFVEMETVEASFVVITEDDTFQQDIDNANVNDNITSNSTNNNINNNNNANNPTTSERQPFPQSVEMAPLSISHGLKSEGTANKRLSSQSSLAMSIDQIRSSLMLHAQEIGPEIIIDRLAALLADNRKLRQAVKSHNENLEKATQIIVKLRKEKAQLEESDKKNFARTKKFVQKLKTDLEEKTKSIAALDSEVNELRRFRVEAAKWQQQFESTQKLLQEQEEEMKLHRSKLRLLESGQLEDGGESASKRTSTSSELSTPSSNENYLEMVAKVSDLEQENLGLELRLEEATSQNAELNSKWIDAESKLKRTIASEKQSEHEALGLRDTIAAYKAEIETLRVEMTRLKSENENLIEDCNVKDLMDQAQRKISTITLVGEEEVGERQVKLRNRHQKPRTKSEDDDLRYNSNEPRCGGAIAAERKSFLEALEKSQEQQKDMEIALEEMKAQIEEGKQKFDEQVEKRVKEMMAASSSSPTRSSGVNRSESHPPQHSVAYNAETATLKNQVISLVEELKQSKTKLQHWKSAEEKAQHQYKMLKTQTEMEETKNKSQLTILREAMEDSDAQLRREKEEVQRVQRELQEQESILRCLEAGPTSGRVRAIDHEKDRLRMEIDRLTAMQFTAEDAINEKDSELSKTRQELAKLRAKLDDNAILQAQVQVYKEDYNAERRMREMMASEKEKVLRENQQLQDQISALNDATQAERLHGGRHAFQHQGRRNEEHTRRPNLNEGSQTQFNQGMGRPTIPASQPSSMANSRIYQNQHNLQQQQRHYQVQQTRGLAGSPQLQQQQNQYALVDREAASLMGRHARNDVPSLTCPFQGIEDTSPGAFSSMSPSIPFVKSDGTTSQTTLRTAAAAAPVATTPPSVSPRLASESSGVNVTRVNWSSNRGSSPARDTHALVAKAPSAPMTTSDISPTHPIAAASPTLINQTSPSLEEDDWQITFGTCPKCQIKYYDMEMLQVHVLECLDGSIE